MMPYGSKHRASENLKTTIANIDFPALVPETHSIVCSKTICSFHSDSNPSCHIYDDHFFCFACSANGDALTWLEHIYGLSKGDGIKELERRVGGGSVTLAHQSKIEKPYTAVKIFNSQPLP
jgi:DNA primase